MKDVFSTQQAAVLCGVDRRSMLRWVAGGHIPSFRTGGGRWRIRRGDLVRFMIERKMPIPAALRRLAVRIAVIDDDAGFIDAISCILGRERPDVELVSARDAFSGGLLVAESRPDVLVLGVGGLDAVDILRRLRASPDLSSVRVAVAMERVEPARRAAVEALGAIAVIEKPVDAATLLKVTGVLPPASPDEAAPG